MYNSDYLHVHGKTDYRSYHTCINFSVLQANLDFAH